MVTATTTPLSPLDVSLVTTSFTERRLNLDPFITVPITSIVQFAQLPCLRGGFWKEKIFLFVSRVEFKGI